MRETLLIYNISLGEGMELFEEFCKEQGIEMIAVSPDEYKVPLGYMAYGSAEQKAPYMLPETDCFTEPLLLFAGFTNQRLTEVLKGLKERRLPRVSLKAVLTEHNAVWDSHTLYEQLAEERAAFETKTGRSPHH